MVSDIPTIIFGADVTHPESGEDTSPSIAAVRKCLLLSLHWWRNIIFSSVRSNINSISQVVASQDWPEVTKYAGLVSAQAHRQEIIQDLYKTWKDPQQGIINGGMIRYVQIFSF